MSERATKTTATELPFEYDGRLVCAVSVSNLESALQWYRDMLGFDVIYKLDDWGWAEVDTPVEGLTIGLGQTEDADGRGATTPTFGVRDIDAARAHLESNGVRFDGETRDAPSVRLATFYDLDGNPWMLAQRLGDTSSG